MVEPGEMLVSDVHFRCKHSIIDENERSNLALTRFPYRVRSTDGANDDACDSDVIVIRHSLSSTLKEVGLQVWNGCLLLADFFLAHPHLPHHASNDDIWLELGAGTGLCSIAAALSRDAASAPKQILCTDVGDQVLNVSKGNLEANLSLLADRQNSTHLLVAEVDFFTFDDENRRVDIRDVSAETEQRNVELLPLLRRASTLFAADVIFDADVTEAFFQLLVAVMTAEDDDNKERRLRSKTLYLALEKRVLFSIYDSEEPSSPIYDHFAACLEGLLTMEFETGIFEAERLPIDFPQGFYKNYERNEYLELWRVNFVFFKKRKE